MARAKYCKCKNTYTINDCDKDNKKCKTPYYWSQGIGKINGISSQEESSPAPTPTPTPTPEPTPTPDPVTMQVDFGRNQAYLMSAFPWNNFATGTSATDSYTPSMSGGETIIGLTDTDGNSTSLNLEITAAFDGYAANTVATDELYVSTAARDCWATPRSGTSTIQLQNCNAERVYDFTFFSSRGYTGNETKFTIGETSVTIAHRDEEGTNTGNVTTTASITGVSPDASNNIDIDVSGFNSSKLIGFINVLEITER